MTIAYEVRHLLGMEHELTVAEQTRWRTAEERLEFYMRKRDLFLRLAGLTEGDESISAAAEAELADAAAAQARRELDSELSA